VTNAPTENLTRADGSPLRVLVVDDEQMLADLLASALRYEGWEVTTAGTGNAAGRPAQDTEFRFSRDTPSIPGILTEAITARELNARNVVKSCRVE